MGEDSDFGGIIGVIIFVIISIVSTVSESKKRKKNAPASKSSEKPKSGGGLQQFFDALSPNDSRSEPVDLMPAPSLSESVERVVHTENSRLKSQSDDATTSIYHHSYEISSPKEVVNPLNAHLDNNTLQDVIILKEILDKPVSLR